MDDLPVAAAAGGRLLWQEATIEAIDVLTPRVKSFRLRPERPFAFRAGQHVDVRLTAPDGYAAQRSYSIGSAPEDGPAFELAIERLDDGEVSPFFHEVVEIGDTIELRGPIGGHFVWDVSVGGPFLLVGGGSGLVPLMSMLRHRAAIAAPVKTALLYSARDHDELIWRDELLRRSADEPGFRLLATLSREARSGFRSGRISEALVGEALGFLGTRPVVTYVCGSNRFVEAATELLLAAGLSAETIRTERYGG